MGATEGMEAVSKPKWKDATSYSRDERGRVDPNAWELVVSDLRIVVHRWHGLEGWYGSCRDLGVEKMALAATVAESAQNEFLVVCRRLCERRAKALAALMDSK